MKRIFVIAIVTALLFACSKNPETASVDCSGPVKSFGANANPVIQTFCATGSNCHGAGSSNGPGPLLNYSQVFNARSDIQEAVLSGHMPPDRGLSATEKAAIICWIRNGALND
ncbi:MAG TPA: hypothetical protein VF487_08870 [Chitinophagaceae bacterium]